MDETQEALRAAMDRITLLEIELASCERDANRRAAAMAPLFAEAV